MGETRTAATIVDRRDRGYELMTESAPSVTLEYSQHPGRILSVR
jgi:hypothetical protein